MASSRRSSRRSVQSRRSSQRNGRRSRRSNASTGYSAITQGVASTGTMPFGSIGGGSPLRALDALSPYHLSLPRPVGPYTVVRTNTICLSGQQCNIFSPEMLVEDGHTKWTHVVGRLSGDMSNPIGGDSSYVVNRGQDFFGPSVTLVPAAFSVQIMNPNSLQETNGIIYIGRSTSQYKLAGDTRTWQDLMNQFVSFMSPRLCSAGKLALRGVKVDSYPLNMSEFSNFCPEAPISGSGGNQPAVWSGTTGPGGLGPNRGGEPSAFAPIVVYNPGQVQLHYLITVEWRVRFDPSQAAAASHQYHKATPISTWDKVCSTASSITHGAYDIADTLSQVGSAVTATQRVLRSFAPAPADVPLPVFGP